MKYQTVNPATNTILNEYAYAPDSLIEETLARSEKSYLMWRKTTTQARQAILQEISSELKQNIEARALLLTQEMGKPIEDSKAEILKAATACDYFAENCAEFLKNTLVPTSYSRSWVSPQPLGVLLGIMPWNYPYWQTLRFAAAALAAGNTIILKQSDLTSGTAIEIENLISRSVLKVLPQFSDSPIFQNIRLTHLQTARVIADQRIRGVSFTGSTRGGREVAIECAKSLKKSVLELGGNDAYIVFEDAPWSETMDSCVASRLVNNGQSCVAGKRFIVHQNRVQKFLTDFTDRMSNYKIGNPELKDTRLGPLAHQKFLISVNQQLETLVKSSSKKSSTERIFAKQSLPGVGAYISPQIIYFKADQGAQLNKFFFEEEVFAPVAFVTSFKDAEQAYALANQSSFGLGGGIYGASEKADALAIQAQNHLEAGLVAINSHVKSDPRLPFGGTKNSGYGRELGPYGFYEFMNMKSVMIR